MVISLDRVRWMALLHLLVLVAFVSSQRPLLASAEDQSVPISSIVANPQANNRRVVVLKGTASHIRTVNGSDMFANATCGQSFTLEDPTGSIEVWYIIRCSFVESAVVIAEHDQLLVTATIDALEGTDVPASRGPKPGFRAMAKEISKLKP